MSLPNPVVIEAQSVGTPFGGVVILKPDGTKTYFAFVPGGAIPLAPAGEPGAVASVFGRIGDVVAEFGDYSLDMIAPPVGGPFTVPNGIRIKPDGSVQLWNPDQSKWHSLQIRGSAGGEYITIGAGET